MESRRYIGAIPEGVYVSFEDYKILKADLARMTEERDSLRLTGTQANELTQRRMQVESLRQQLADQEAVIGTLKERLEMDFGYDADGNRVVALGIPDGIACRDATIQLQDDRISDLQAQLQAAREAAQTLDQMTPKRPNAITYEQGWKIIDHVRDVLLPTLTTPTPKEAT